MHTIDASDAREVERAGRWELAKRYASWIAATHMLHPAHARAVRFTSAPNSKGVKCLREGEFSAPPRQGLLRDVLIVICGDPQWA